MSRKRSGDSPLYTEKWKIIEEASECAFSNKLSRYSFQSVHHAVFQICQAKYGEVLLESLQEFFVLQGRELAEQLKMTDSRFFLEKFVNAWEGYSLALHRIGSLLLYFQNYLTTTHRPSVKEIGEHIFCMTVLKDGDIQQRLEESVRESVSDAEKWETLREYSSFLLHVDRGVFFHELENIYLEVVGEQCSQEGKAQSAKGNVEEYLIWVEKTLAYHEERIAATLSPSSVPHLRNYILELLVGAAEFYLLSSSTGCVSMVRQWNFRGIHRVVEAFDKRGNLAGVIEVLTSEVKKMILAILADHNNEEGGTRASNDEVIKDTLALLRNCETLATHIPRTGTSSVETSPVLKALYDVVNNVTKFPDTLSLYYDSHIRHPDTVSVQQLSEDVLALLRVLRDRDAFEVFFRNHLAARIMHAKPEALEIESYFIERMREEGGPASVSRLEKMIMDVREATSTQERLKAAMASSNYVLPLDFRASVLTAGFWPQYASTTFPLPASMQTCMAVFQQFYTLRHNGRKLSFQLNLGTVGFRFQHAGQTHAVSAPTPFVCILTSLNSDDDISVNSFSEMSGLPISDVMAQVATLSKHGLLIASPSNARGSAASHYRFNQGFSSQAQKIRIGAGPHKITKEASLNPSGRTSLKASHVMGLESTIIKILKANKTVDHASLCVSVENAMKSLFMPTRVEIKERIDALIERGFLTRGSRQGLYVYSS